VPNKLVIEKNKKNVETMFNDIATSYDFLNHFLSANTDKSWRKKCVKLLENKSPQNILDVATGTGDLAISLLKLNPKKITGIDISNEMLEIGRNKILKLGKSAIVELLQGDAENIKFNDGSFDAVTVAFGVRNFENLNRGLSELYRVLIKSGTLLILEFSKPQKNLISKIFNLYFKNLLPFMGKLLSNNNKAYKYLYQSVEQFASVEEMVQNLKKCGFSDIKTKQLSMGIATIYLATK